MSMYLGNYDGNFLYNPIREQLKILGLFFCNLNLLIFFLFFLHKNVYVMSKHYKYLGEVLPVGTHNIFF